MRYTVLIFIISLGQIGLCQSKLETLVITNTLPSKISIQFFDKYYHFNSINLERDSSVLLNFKGGLSLKISSNYKDKAQLLCLKSDSISLTESAIRSEKLQLSTNTILFKPEVFQDITSLDDDNLYTLINQIIAPFSFADPLKDEMKENLIYFFFDNFLFDPHKETYKTQDQLDKALLLGEKHLRSNQTPYKENYLYNNAIIKYNDFYFKTHPEKQNIFEFIKENYDTTQQNILLFNALDRLVTRRESEFLKNYPKYNDAISNLDYNNHLQRTYFSLTQTNSSSTMLIRYSDYKTIPLDSLYLLFEQKEIVYDFSASWCIPCLENIPKLIDHVKGKPNTTYAIISIDKNINDWNPIIEQYRLNPENCFFIVDGIKSPFAQKYRLESIPRYMYINNTGKIIDAHYNIHRDNL